MATKALLILMGCASVAQGAVSVLSNSGHAAVNGTQAVNIVAPGALGSTIFMDATNTSQIDGFLSYADAITATQDTGRSNFRSVDYSGPVNNAPYTLLTQSSTGYTISLDTTWYSTLLSLGVLYNTAYVAVPASAPGTPPPVTFAVIASTSFPAGAGWGVEFTIANGYKSLPDTVSTSGVTSDFAGFFAALKLNHPTWNWQDIKAAVRQTSSNWATGYNPTTYGYGTLDYDSANALNSTSSLYLQPPVMQASSPGTNRFTLTLYPYRQTRRDHEVVYLIPTDYHWPIKNEYVTADITASGGTLIYTSNGTDIIPTATVTASVPPGHYNLIAFTADNLGNFSRVEAFSPTAVMDQCQ